MIETNPRSAEGILLIASDSLDRAAFRVELAACGLDFFDVGTIGEALEILTHQLPELILCEVELPDGSGFAFTRSLRENPDISPKPMVILLSRWAYESDKILGFECGADDFVTMPFYPRELASRVRALLRRRLGRVETEVERPSSASSQGVSIDPDQRTVWMYGDPIRLTDREISIFAALGRSEGRVVSRADLLAQIGLSSEVMSERSIDAHIKGLRNKLGNAQNCIETVHGRGYRYSGKPVSTVRRDDSSVFE